MGIFGLPAEQEQINWYDRFRYRLDEYDFDKLGIEKEKLYDVLDYLHRKGVVN